MRRENPNPTPSSFTYVTPSPYASTSSNPQPQPQQYSSDLPPQFVEFMGRMDLGMGQVNKKIDNMQTTFENRFDAMDRRLDRIYVDQARGNFPVYDDYARRGFVQANDPFPSYYSWPDGGYADNPGAHGDFHVQHDYYSGQIWGMPGEGPSHGYGGMPQSGGYQGGGYSGGLYASGSGAGASGSGAIVLDDDEEDEENEEGGNGDENFEDETHFDGGHNEDDDEDEDEFSDDF